MLRVVLRSYQFHRTRLALVVGAIAVGVAFLAGTFVLSDTDHTSIAQTTELAYSHVAVAVEGGYSSSYLPGTGHHVPVPETLERVVDAVPGVVRTAGVAEGYAQLVSPSGSLIGPTASALGTSVAADPALNPFVLDRGHEPGAADQVVVDVNTVRAQGWHLGQHVRIVTDEPVRAFTLVGIVSSRNSTDVVGSTLVGFTPATAHAVLGLKGQDSVVLVTAARGVRDGALAARLRSAVGPDDLALSGSQFVAQNVMYASTGAPQFSLVLDVVLGLALFVCSLVIFNIVSIMVAQRRSELAMLQCLGASRLQIWSSVVAEGAVIGLLASAAGLALGTLGAWLLQGVVSSGGVQSSGAGLVVGTRTVAVCLGVGTVVTAVASVIPAVAASRTPPIGALRRDVLTRAEEDAARAKHSGFVLMACGSPFLVVGLLLNRGGQEEIWIVGIGLVLFLVGLGRVSPLTVPPLVGALGWPIARFGGLPGDLGRQNTTRDARRTVATATSLIVGVGLVSVLAVMETSAERSNDSQIAQALTANFEVLHAGSGPLSAGSAASSPLSPEVLSKLAAQRGLVVSPYSFVNFRGGWGVAVDPGTIGRMADFGTVHGDLGALAQGGFAVSSQIAASSHLHLGEKVRFRFFGQLLSGASTVLRLDATYSQGDLALSGFMFSSTSLGKAAAPLELSAVLVRAGPGVDRAAASRLVTRALGGFPDVSVQSPAQVQAAEDRQVASRLDVISVLLVLAVLVAVLGVVNTMGLAMVERTRELAMLRAVGMTRDQLRTMVRAEATLIGVVGALLGVALGVFVGWAFQRALSTTQGITELVVPWSRLVLYVVGGAVIGFVAGTIPARGAARVNMLDAIASE